MYTNKFNGGPTSPEHRRKKFAALLSEPQIQEDDSNYHSYYRFSIDSPRIRTKISDMITMSNYSNPTSATSSPYNNNFMASPWAQPSPYTKSPWTHIPPGMDNVPKHGLIGSLLREEGHIYSLAASGDLLYTGSDSRNIRVWKGMEDFAGFKSSSGLVKAIVVFKDRVFTGHQDGRIRVWRGGRRSYKRVGSLPTTRDLLMKSINPRNYVRVRRHRNVPWIKHFDAVSCMSVDVQQGLLYSGSWDKTVKVWRISDSKCLESIHAHDDAVNSVVIGFDGLVFTGSADGSVKAWRRELVGKYTEHVLVDTLLRQEHAITSLAVSHTAGVLYAGSSNGLVSFWERGKHFMSYGGVLRGHKLAVLCLSIGGNLVLSGSADKSICAWRRETGGEHVCAAVLTGHSGPVKCLTMEKDARRADEEGDDEPWVVYSGSLDKSVKVWRVSGYAPNLKDIISE